MKSYWMQMTEGGWAIEQRDVAAPTPGTGQLLVRLKASSLNRGEFVSAFGKTTAWKAIGGEGAGEVVATGPGAEAWSIGDRVMGRCAGAFAEYALIDIAEAMAVPPNLSWEEAASIPLTFLVSYDMLVVQGRLEAGEWVLINGVSSGVGVSSLQLAKALGAKVIGTSGSQAKLDLLAPLGLDVGIATRAPTFADAVMKATDKAGADIVVNTVGGSVFAENIRSMAFEGRLATVGYVDNVLHADLDIEALHARRLRVYGVSNKLRSKAQKSAAVPSFIAEVLPLFASGRIKPQIDRVYPFADLVQAKDRMEAGDHVGKIALRIE